jgi:hypothetical protein
VSEVLAVFMAHLRLDTLTYTGLIRQAPTRSPKEQQASLDAILSSKVRTVSLGVKTWDFLAMLSSVTSMWSHSLNITQLYVKKFNIS